jgi:hypothetical protein
MRKRSAIVIATPAVAALATASSACAGHRGRIVFQRFDPRIGEDRPPPGNAEGDGQPDLSPDGSKVVFHRLYNDGSPDDLIVVNADGGHPGNMEAEWL